MVLFEDIQTFEVDTDGNMLPIEPYSSNDNSKLPEVETSIYTSESSGRASSEHYMCHQIHPLSHIMKHLLSILYIGIEQYPVQDMTRNQSSIWIQVLVISLKETQPTSSSLLPSQSLKPVKLTDFNQVVIEPACSALLPSQPQKAMNLTEINQVVIKPTRKMMQELVSRTKSIVVISVANSFNKWLYT
nr:unnamed protein product [Callosobruchus analis]